MTTLTFRDGLYTDQALPLLFTGKTSAGHYILCIPVNIEPGPAPTANNDIIQPLQVRLSAPLSSIPCSFVTLINSVLLICNFGARQNCTGNVRDDAGP